MAKQEYSALKREFTLDFHHVQTKEAARVTRARLAECFRYGIRSLKCVYGSPDVFPGSIAEAILDVAFTDERVVSDALADWVFSDDIDVSTMPIFLVLPVKVNPDPVPLTPEASFTGFVAGFEPLASLRLLCKMPFQPLRDYYDWQYAARAIGNGCKEGSLKEYCAVVGLGVRHNGLSLSELLNCADEYGRWSAGRIKQPGPPTVPTALPERTQLEPPTFYSHTQPRSIEALFRQAERQLSDEELDECRGTLEVALGLLEDDAHRWRYELLLGRILSRENHIECEGHLLRADQICTGIYGKSSPLRISILRELASWYGRSGEVSQLLAISEMSGMINLSDSAPPPIKKRFASDFGYARLLRQAGLYQESVHVLRLFIWRALLGKSEEMPAAFGTPLEALTKGKLSKVQIATLNLLYAMNCTDDGDGDFDLAIQLLDLSHVVLTNVGGQEILRSEIEQERGRIARKKGDFDRALRHYDVAGRLIRDAKDEDPYRLYELYLSRGVVKVQKGDLKSASADYERAWELAQALQLVKQIFIYPLLLSRATLALRKKDFITCERLASEAADLLTLKAVERHKDIALARLRQGVALYHLEDYGRAFQGLSEAQREFEVAGTFGVHRTQLELYLELANSKRGIELSGG